MLTLATSRQPLMPSRNRRNSMTIRNYVKNTTALSKVTATAFALLAVTPALFELRFNEVIILLVLYVKI